MELADLNLELLKFIEVQLKKGTTYIKLTYSIMDKDPPIKPNMSLIKPVDLPWLQFPWLNLSTFGVPPKGEYTKEDKQRMFIKVPIDDDIDLYRQIIALDHKLKYEIIETKSLAIFGSGNMYENEPLLRFNIKTGKAYIKFKLDTTYPDNHILTEVWCVKDGSKHQCQFDKIEVKPYERQSQEVNFLDD